MFVLTIPLSIMLMLMLLPRRTDHYYNPILLHTVFVSFVDDQLTVNETFGVVDVCVEIVEGTVTVNSRINLTTTAISATGITSLKL